MYEWEERFSTMGPQEILHYRSFRLKDFDGISLPHLYKWPKDIRTLLFHKYPPISGKNAYKLSLFLIGNGYSTFRTGKWILTYYSLCEWKKRNHMVKKRIKELAGLLQRIKDKDNDLFYYDVRTATMKKFNEAV